MNRNRTKLSQRISFIECSLADKIRFIKTIFLAKMGRSRYRSKYLGGHKVLSIESGNEWLYNQLISGKPFSAVRYGGTELGTYKHALAYELGFENKLSQDVADNIQRQSGFFPNDKNLLLRYKVLLEELSPYVDFLATYATAFENYMLRNFIPKTSVVGDNRAMEPYYLEEGVIPWTKALEGKRVLVIHPFAESIEKQYAKRELLFPQKDFLPQFELHTLKAVQTIVGTKDERFETWFDALEWMYEEAMKIPFDVAILGCGAYGLPLACKLRKAGKQAIHIGGATQILFGIIGRRWELNSKEVSALFNEHWIRPSAEETPQNKQKNEFGGAYW